MISASFSDLGFGVRARVRVGVWVEDLFVYLRVRVRIRLAERRSKDTGQRLVEQVVCGDRQPSRIVFSVVLRFLMTDSPVHEYFVCFWCILVTDIPADLCFSWFLVSGSSADRCFWCSAEAVRPSQPSRSLFFVFLVFFGDRQPSRKGTWSFRAFVFSAFRL